MVNSLYDKVDSVYQSGKMFAQKSSDKMLLGFITLETMLGNPTSTYASQTQGAAPVHHTPEQAAASVSGFIITGVLAGTCYHLKKNVAPGLSNTSDRQLVNILSTIGMYGFGALAIGNLLGC